MPVNVVVAPNPLLSVLLEAVGLKDKAITRAEIVISLQVAKQTHVIMFVDYEEVVTENSMSKLVTTLKQFKITEEPAEDPNPVPLPEASESAFQQIPVTHSGFKFDEMTPFKMLPYERCSDGWYIVVPGSGKRHRINPDQYEQWVATNSIPDHNCHTQMCPL